ncbi:MAG: hypothetical protein ACXVAY_01505 [Mucilaginibacter sp.]
MSKYSQFFAILKRNGLEKEEVILEFTKGRSDSLSKLMPGEYEELMRRLARYNAPPPGDKQRKKMISIARQMNWGNDTNEVIAALNSWLLKQKFKKALNNLTVQELGVMVTILEGSVYKGYLAALNK